jgi:hypothetical protein
MYRILCWFLPFRLFSYHESVNSKKLLENLTGNLLWCSVLKNAVADAICRVLLVLTQQSIVVRCAIYQGLKIVDRHW